MVTKMNSIRENGFCYEHKHMFEMTTEIKEEIKEIKYEIKNIENILAERNGILKGIRISLRSIAIIISLIMGYLGIKSEYVEEIIKDILG